MSDILWEKRRSTGPERGSFTVVPKLRQSDVDDPWSPV